MIEKVKSELKKELDLKLHEKYGTDIQVIVEEPKKVSLGDISVPVFQIVKVVRKPLPDVVNEVISLIQNSTYHNHFEAVEAMGGFINIKLNKVSISKEIIQMFDESSTKPASLIGEGKTICMDYSSPNIAKPFSIGHLRSTIIGHAIGNLLEKCSYKVVRINHLGDFGTQFGKIIYAYLNYGDPEVVKKNPVEELVKLYVEFHELAKENPALEDEARKIFKELEQKNPTYQALWTWMREESLKDYMKIYDLLGVSFDSYNGEAFYNDLMQPVIDELISKGLLKEDEGAMIVDLGETMPPALIQKTDGSTLYMTRDLAALFYRKDNYSFDKMLYVVGNEQKLHFEQIKKVIDKMGYDFSENVIHVNFGLVLQDGKKMSTRKGKIVKLEDVLNEAIELSYDHILEKNPNLENKEEIAKKIGVSAIIFNDLKNYRSNDFEFNLDEMTNFSGQTGPYLQYTSVRITSILNSVDGTNNRDLDYNVYLEETAFEMLKQISIFDEIIEKSALEYAPSILAKYLLNLASLFNSYYGKEKINVEDTKERNAKLKVLQMVREVLNTGMSLLGMSLLEKM
ncbi:MAG: arginine--tRNA ligase [Candidatus Izemoplasmatales bacterium]